jgi:hypothetical protein
VCDNHQQYPIVKDLATMRTAPLAGIAAMIGMPSDFGWGSFVTYDRESNFVPAAKHGYGSANPASIVGQITGITVFKDPTTNAKVGNHNYLDKVVGPNQATANVLNQLPSSHNDGMGTFLTYSNGYGMVEFGVQTR